MRKILLLPRNGLVVIQAAFRQVSLVAFGASLTVTLCCSSPATAQTISNYVTPAAAANMVSGPVSGGPVSGGPVSGGPVSGTSPAAYQLSASDASYSLSSDTTRVQPASYLGGVGSYCPTDGCVTGCDVSYYVNFDALWLRRSNDRYFSLSRNSYLPNFDYELGGRYTVGQLWDCVNGWEGVYTGPFDWQRQNAVLGAGNLQSNFVPGGGYTLADIDTFNNANQHIQAWNSEIHSFELNRRWWTWDVISTMIGVRYLDYQEQFLFLSDSNRGLGLYRNNVENRLAGAQVGADMLYPVSLRGSLGFRGKAGVYANFDEQNVLLQNDGSTLINAGDSSVDVAGIIEMGIFGNYQIVPSVRLTAGYEFWYLPGVVTVPSQSPAFINPSTGTRLDNDNELFLHGGSVGVQVLF